MTLSRLKHHPIEDNSRQYATWLETAKVNYSYIIGSKGRTGTPRHKDITTTMNIYSHVLPSSAKEAAEKIGQLVYDVG